MQDPARLVLLLVAVAGAWDWLDWLWSAISDEPCSARLRTVLLGGAAAAVLLTG